MIFEDFSAAVVKKWQENSSLKKEVSSSPCCIPWYSGSDTRHERFFKQPEDVEAFQSHLSPLKAWLMTPFIMPATVHEMLYNRKQTETRILKMRFRCLDKSGGTIQHSPQKVEAFFVAC